jgi:hypothetical protein
MASFSKLDLTFLALAYEAYPRRARMSDVLAHPVVNGVGLVQSLMPKQEDRRIEGFSAQP